MNWLDDLFGAGKRNSIAQAGERESNAILDKAKAEALAASQAGQGQARTDINTGYDAAGNILSAADPSIRSDINAGYDASNASMRGDVDKANAFLDPFYQSGLAAQDRYDTALGLDGKDAADSFFQDYAANDPYRAFRDEMANKQIAQQFAASGNMGGRMGLAVGRASLERGSVDLDNYMSRLERAGARGGQFAERMAGNTMAGGQFVAQNEASRGSALAGLGERMASLKSGYEANRGVQLGDAAQRGASQASNLISQTGQLQAANRLGTRQFEAGQVGSGLNSLLGLAGTALKAGTLYNNWGTPQRGMG